MMPPLLSSLNYQLLSHHHRDFTLIINTNSLNHKRRQINPYGDERRRSEDAHVNESPE